MVIFFVYVKSLRRLLVMTMK